MTDGLFSPDERSRIEAVRDEITHRMSDVVDPCFFLGNAKKKAVLIDETIPHLMLTKRSYLKDTEIGRAHV